jgi:DNA-binding transcriptional ArsR family regulator
VPENRRSGGLVVRKAAGAILLALQRQGPLSTRELMRAAGVSHATLHRSVRLLRDAGVVLVFGRAEGPGLDGLSAPMWHLRSSLPDPACVSLGRVAHSGALSEAEVVALAVLSCAPTRDAVQVSRDGEPGIASAAHQPPLVRGVFSSG